MAMTRTKTSRMTKTKTSRIAKKRTLKMTKTLAKMMIILLACYSVKILLHIDQQQNESTMTMTKT